MNKLVGDFSSERAHQIGMPFKEADMLMIRHRDQSIDLDGKIAPVFEKQFDR